MSGITDGFKDIFLAGIGAMAKGAEKSKEIVDQLIAKGELTVDQGKQLNSELVHRASEATGELRDDLISARMAVMTPEERAEFVKRVAELAAEVDKVARGASAVPGSTFVSDIDAEEVAQAANPEPAAERANEGEPAAADASAAEKTDA